MPLIEAKEISRIYKIGDVEVNALRGVSLSIEKGDFVSVMGPSGSGKSTFMNILGCLDKPTGGKYFLDEIDVSKFNKNDLAGIRNKKLGFVFQSFNLLPRTTAIENVELPLLYNGISAKERRAKALTSLEAVGLRGRERHNPNQLSGGEQQRIAIARAIVNNAPIILADEPTGNLDTKTSAEIMNFFVKLNKESKITIIIVTHESDIAAYSRRIVRFLDGKIVSDEIREGVKDFK
ncbi:MAG: macrolide ABC transporter ATP-binding protein [Candidatus Schekmanbacteria bacterium RBG_16_38_10]|uniref:Macrolide ABC transporter ATP-binding protein n=1 Tax=Candidatus Schekmanbacteria bacterium RBG_16_38_10 TaxID=1817879 RepID=A0A1F7RUG7_9BACT|nr:MAG: macrolide ABC transporter ATP-binding protein [Candidatus Schekmanbacteria bacterium RBG_16_38_10]